MNSGVCHFCSICLRYSLMKSDITCNIWSSSAYINLPSARPIIASSTSPIFYFPKTDAKSTMCCRWSFQKKLEDSRWLFLPKTTTKHSYVSVPALRIITTEIRTSFKTHRHCVYVLSTRPTPKFPPKFINKTRMCRVVQSKNNDGWIIVCLLAVSKRKRRKIHVFELPKRSRTRREEWRCWPTLASLSYSTSSAKKNARHIYMFWAVLDTYLTHQNSSRQLLEHLATYHRAKTRLFGSRIWRPVVAI